MRIDYLRGNDAVAEFASLRHQNYDVVEPDVSQGPKKRVAMAGEAHVSGLSGQRRARDMSHRASKHILSGALRNHGGKAQARTLTALVYDEPAPAHSAAAELPETASTLPLLELGGLLLLSAGLVFRGRASRTRLR
jgi:hypothetical protein